MYFIVEDGLVLTGNFQITVALYNKICSLISIIYNKAVYSH